MHVQQLLQYGAFHFFINQVFSCQHQSQANKCTWWQHRQREGESVWKISTRNTFAQLP
ncbi:MAG: hypothetical protein ACLRXB_12655 [Escherichia coli]